MGRFVAGNVVAVHFPFSNLKGQKLRPALILAIAEFDNLILCQITSKPYASRTAIRLEKKDFTEGKLPVTSYIRPDKLFTGDPSIIEKRVGQVSKQTLHKVLQKVRKLFISR